MEYLIEDTNINDYLMVSSSHIHERNKKIMNSLFLLIIRQKREWYS